MGVCPIKAPTLCSPLKRATNAQFVVLLYRTRGDDCDEVFDPIDTDRDDDADGYYKYQGISDDEDNRK